MYKKRKLRKGMNEGFNNSVRHETNVNIFNLTNEQSPFLFDG